MLGWIGLHADDRYLRLASGFFALTGATGTIGGICFTTISAFHVTPT